MSEWVMNNGWVSALIIVSVGLNVILITGIKDLYEYYNHTKNT